MKKKKKRTLVLLCACLVILVGAYAAVMAYNQKPADKEQETAAEETVKILETEGTISKIRVESQNGTMSFILKDDVWYEENNVGFNIRQSSLMNMAGLFTSLAATHTIEQNTENLADYGLDKPQYVLTGTTAEGKEAVLYVGMQNTVTSEYYVYTDELAGVYTVGAASVNYFTRNLMDFAELPEYPYVTEGNFQSIETINNGEHMKAEVLSESEYDMSGLLMWYVTEPYEHEYVAHTTTLDTIMSAVAELSYSKAAAFNASAEELAAMGLAEPSKELAFTYKEADTETEATETTAEAAPAEILSYHLYIGNDNGNGYYYVQEKDSKLVMLMAKSSLDTILAYTSKDIVNKYFALINIDSVDSIEIVLDDKSEYTMNPPGSEAKDDASEKLKDVYQSIIGIHAEKVVDSYTGTLSMLPLSITFNRNVDPKTYKIEFAEYDTSYYLAVVDGEGIYLVNKRDYDQYCANLKEGFEALEK